MNSLLSKSDKIFVAGHNGMAGSAICRALEKRGYKNILKCNRKDLDLADFSAVRDWYKSNKPDIVILAAATVGGIQANKNYPVNFLLDNLKIQNNVIEISWRSDVKRLLFLGSSCIYPKFSKQPIKEEELLTGSLEPTNEWYALAKITGIKLCMALRKQYNFDAISLMPTNLYGPGDNYHPTNSHVLPAFIRRFEEAAQKKDDKVICWGTGSPMREFLHVDDLGDASVFVLEKWRPSLDEVQFLNVGTGTDLTIKELAEEVSLATNFKGKIIWDKSKPDGTPKKQLDVSRLQNMGWNSTISLKEGLKNTVDIYRKEKKNFSD